MIVLLVKTSLIVIIVFGFYKVLIEKESFFSTNRMYLILGLLLTFTIPFISLPKLINNQGFVSELIEPSIAQNSSFEELNDANKSDNPNIDSVNIATEQTTNTVVTTESSRSLLDWLFIVYLFGVIILTINLLAQIGNLVFKIIRSKDKIGDKDGIIINSEHIKEPYSFFNYIFINPEQYEFEIYEQIIAHEKIHVKKRHSLDLLLSEIAVILLWFNPFIWLFRKEVEKNIEYQTDHLVIDTKSAEKDSYQMNLLKIATFNKPLTITTNYNQSLIKQRILKMNSKKSNPHSYWKYAFTLPMFFALLLLLNKPYAAFGQQDRPTLNDILIPTDIESKPDYFSDCEAFKKALEDKDVEKLKEILVNLDPACTVYIENSKHATLTSVKTKLKEGAALKLDTTGDIVVTDSNGTLAIDAKGISEEVNSPNTECRPLLEAIRANDINAVRNLLKTTDVNCIDPNPGYDETKSNGNYWRHQKAKAPLFVVARTGNLEIAKLLVDKGSNVKLNIPGDGTALITAAEYGHLEVLKYFVSKGADINRKFPNQGNALIAASSNGYLDIMEYLVSNGDDIDHYSSSQGNALIAASRNGQKETVKLLLENGADINAQNNSQGSALNAAARRGHLDTVKLLLEKGADINLQNNGQGSALNAAARNGKLDTVKLLLEKGADINLQNIGQGSALNAAARRGHLDTVKLLLEKGADINLQNNGQGSALNAAARNGKLDTVKLLLEKGADINLQNNKQGTALNAATRNGHLDTAKLLLEKGADINL